jgi:predicted metal-dependent enzyme (double-stranded beta helix superfamily)
MKWTTAGVLMSMAFQTYPPAFPREGSIKVFENERVIVWDHRWIKGRPTPMHEHVLDLVGVVLEAGQTKLIFPDGSSREGPLSRIGQVAFQPTGVIHIEESLAETSRVIGIELKNHPVPVAPEMTGIPKAFPREGATLLMDNDRVAIWDYRWLPGRTVPLHFHDRDAVVVPIETGRVRFTSPDGRARISPQNFGEVTFAARNESDREEIVEGSPRAIIVELK